MVKNKLRQNEALNYHFHVIKYGPTLGCRGRAAAMKNNEGGQRPSGAARAHSLECRLRIEKLILEQDPRKHREEWVRYGQQRLKKRRIEQTQEPVRDSEEVTTDNTTNKKDEDEAMEDSSQPQDQMQEYTGRRKW